MPAAVKAASPAWASCAISSAGSAAVDKPNPLRLAILWRQVSRQPCGSRDQTSRESARQAPDVDGQFLITAGQADVGELVQLKITDSSEYDLIGEIVSR